MTKISFPAADQRHNKRLITSLAVVVLAVISLLGFFVTAGLAREDVLAGWRARALAVGLSGLLLLGLLTGLLYWLWRAEAALKENEELMRSTFEQAAVGIAHIAPDTYRILMANDKFCDLLGYTQDELTGTDSRLLTPPDDMPARTAERAQVMAGKIKTSSSERCLIRKTGASLWVNRSLSLVRDPAGQPRYFISVIEDITERKQAQAERAQLAAIVESSNDAMISRTVDGRILTWNKGAERLFGYTAAEMIGANTLALMPPDLVAETYHNREYLNQGNALNGYETVRVTKDGRRVSVSLNSSPIRDAVGNVMGVASVFHDITERKQAEKRQAMEHAVTRVLAEAETSADAIPRIIQTICESLGWACGAHWRWDDTAEVLRCAETWHIDAAEVADFIATASKTINEAPAWHGEAPRTKTGGLVRRVWMDGAPVWFPDVTREPEFRRGLIAAKAGLHCAFAFPVMAGAQPLGVMEFYSRNIAKPDEALLQVVTAIGSQIGQFLRRKRAEERIQYLAAYDSLTSLPNRNMFRDRLALVIARAKRSGQMAALMFLDLDRFKEINDTLGHAAGDKVLQATAGLLRTSLRDVDTISRLGGDEFTVVLENIIDVRQVTTIGEKIKEAFTSPIIIQEGRDIFVTASIGIALYPLDADNIDALLHAADVAMYRAKQEGRNTYEFYLSEPNARADVVRPMRT